MNSGVILGEARKVQWVPFERFKLAYCEVLADGVN